MNPPPPRGPLPEIFAGGIAAPVAALHGPLHALGRNVNDLARSYRELAAREDLHAEADEVAVSPASTLAELIDTLTTLSAALAVAHDLQSAAYRHAARLRCGGTTATR